MDRIQELETEYVKGMKSPNFSVFLHMTYGVDDFLRHKVAAALANPSYEEKLAVSHNPQDWLVSFAARCRLAANHDITYVSLTNSLVMMGPCDDWKDESDKPHNYDDFIKQTLCLYNLCKKIIRVLRDDLKRSEDNPNKITSNDYAHRLIAWLRMEIK